jgi:hypothetical protein
LATSIQDFTMTKPTEASTAVTSTRLALLGPPPLLNGEDPAAYD